MSDSHHLIPIYTTKGNLGAYLVYPYLYDPQGEWIGWVTPDRQVYSVYGHHVGWLTDDPRIVSRRAPDFSKPRYRPPPAPDAIRPPGSVPLSPMMRELAFSEIDVLDDAPDLLPTLDHGELKQDLD